MPNLCEIIITRGKNKGKMCKNINRTCRHKKITCQKCGVEFSYRHTYVAHLCNSDFGSKLELRPKPKVKVTPTISNLERRLEILESQNRSLESRVERAEQRPPSINNIVVIGNDFYSELVDKVGREDAIRYLTSAATCKPIEVIDKLYLEGKDPMNYPIACKNTNHFRYLNSESKIIDDRGGDSIGNLVTNQLQNAILMAINEAISDTEATAALCDIVEAQRYVSQGVDKEKLLLQLSKITNNDSHPFFKN